MGSLYEKLGGKTAVAAVVNDFYDRMLADEELNYIFKGTDMEKLRAHQTLFISYALGGPQKFEGRTLRQSHTGLNISDEQYEKTIQHLNAALRGAGVPAEDCIKVEAFIRSVKPHIINK